MLLLSKFEYFYFLSFVVYAIAANNLYVYDAHFDNLLDTNNIIEKYTEISAIQCSMKCSILHNCVAFYLNGDMQSSCFVTKRESNPIWLSQNGWIFFRKTKGCLDSWERYRRSCYKIFVRNVTWQQAKDLCSREGSYLAEIKSRTENTFIKSLMKDFGASRLWIGGNDISVKPLFRWDHSRSALSFTDWAPSSPSFNYSDSQCIGITYVSGEVKWVDLVCSDIMNFICEKSIHI